MYKFIHDETELKRFYDILVPALEDFEVLFLSLSCRKKYLSQEEREKYHITRAEMFDRKIVRKNEWDRFVRTVKKYESSEGSYLTKNGFPVPQHCMVIYFNINPSNSLKALKEFQGKMVDWQYEIVSGNKASFKDKFNKLDIELMNCYQRNRGSKHLLDIDFDVPKELNIVDEMREYLEGTSLSYWWVDTKSGYHLLIDRSTLYFNPNDICKKGLGILSSHLLRLAEREKALYPVRSVGNEVHVGEKPKVYEVVVNKDAMIPLPGCYQGMYPVRVLWEDSRVIDPYKEE